jgi:hypothetical protein
MDHSLKYPIEYIFNTNAVYYTRKGSAIFIFGIINPIGYKTGRGLLSHNEVFGIGDSGRRESLREKKRGHFSENM